MEYGLGRRFAPDDRDKNFPMKGLLPKRASRRKYRYWYSSGWWGNQGTSSQCVAYGWSHWLSDGPIRQKGPQPVMDPGVLYHEAQLVDEWPGPPPPYDGTSVRAGAKVLQSLGYISSYHWATTLDELIQAVLGSWPVVVGTNWYAGMFNPGADNFARISGSVVGGHCYLVNGVNMDIEAGRIKNSWGRSWGRSGFAQVSFKDLERLIKEDGEICVAQEVSK